MQWNRLAGPLFDAGLTILGGVLGGPAGGIAVTIGREVAARLGVSTPEEVEAAIKTDPKALAELRAFQSENAEELALLMQEQEHMRDMLAREDKGPWWAWAWRPATMWLIGFLWFWSLIAVHLINGMTGLKLPVAPMEHLLAFTGLFLSLYMGGHTVKSVLEKRR